MIKDAIQSLIVALQGLVNIAIWLALFILPIALIIGLPLFFIIRGVRSRRRRNKDKDASEESELPPTEGDDNKN